MSADLFPGLVVPRPSWQIVEGDNREVLARLPDACVDAVVTDPPYELAFMGKRWDATGIAFDPDLWRAVLRVLKPGGHLLAFSGTRTYHRMVCAIEDAGFEIRDQLAWMFGTGFPKSKNVAMSIDKGEGVIGHRSIAAVTAGVDDNSGGRGPDRSVGAYVPGGDTPGAAWAGWGTALKPAHEPIVLARKPLIGTVAANVLAHGTGGLNVDSCRIGSEARVNAPAGNKPGTHAYNMGVVGMPQDAEGRDCIGRWPANVLMDEWLDPVLLLRDNAPSAVREFYADHEGVRGVRVPDDDPAEPQDEDALLLAGLLRSGLVSADAGSASDARPQASPGFTGQDARVEIPRADAGPGIPGMEGRSAHEPRLRDCGAVLPVADRTGHVREHGHAQQPTMHPGASPGDGAPPWQTAGSGGIGAPPQRDQERQSDRESGDARQRDAQARACSDLAGAAISASGDRPIEARASEVPMRWRKYFVSTGQAIRCGAAAMLDAQSGTVPGQQGRASQSGKVASSVALGDKRVHANMPEPRGDTGGASRFFYTAKASKSEREAGLDHLPVRSGGELTDRTDGSDGLNSPRAGAGRGGGRRNHHPTVKPIALMRYLVRLITPPGGIVLDPFAGSGSTIAAAVLEGFSALGIELSAEYADIARARVAHWETKA
jgi:hypothetical protein